MPTLALGAFPGWLTRIMELRIDVDPGSWKLDNELDSLYSRITRPGDRLHDMPEVKTEIPGLVLRYREADGEFYVYLVDQARGRLAGYTVFNRLVEVGRRADPYLRAPHSKYDQPYQRRGLAAAVYRWALEAGQCLITGARQSGAARALWQSLARHYESGYVDVRRTSGRKWPKPSCMTCTRAWSCWDEDGPGIRWRAPPASACRTRLCYVMSHPVMVFRSRIRPGLNQEVFP